MDTIDDAIELMTGIKPERFHKLVKRKLKGVIKIPKRIQSVIIY